ncbi:lysoplasmalogenase [Oscillochloris sp. ZM17-4]|uniref:lysoplasmalogenase family protein n=1 Tax=Oscillochloris sp. ZM17-4 TaxID=2866714 RepID=UPI001C73CCB7|nr:lysoplasmalogenase family protein [Oscillochloris sp. ZM17-4]MBX0329550.1 lysoplasmalogenase [Oscillochloris sp. ZM17-4]
MNTLTAGITGALGALAILGNILALLLGRPNATGTSRAIPWLQRSTSLMLALAAWGFALVGAAGTPLAPFSLAIAVGMSVSFIADLIMAEIIRVPNRVIGGIVVFAAAHLAYIAATLMLARALGRIPAPAMIACSAALVLGGAAYWRVAVDVPAAPAPLRWGSLGYLVALGVMTGLAWGMAITWPPLWPLAAGALLFFISDAILGNQIFRHNNWPSVGDVVWITYILGQAGIVWANAAALTLAAGG